MEAMPTNQPLTRPVPWLDMKTFILMSIVWGTLHRFHRHRDRFQGSLCIQEVLVEYINLHQLSISTPQVAMDEGQVWELLDRYILYTKQTKKIILFIKLKTWVLPLVNHHPEDLHQREIATPTHLKTPQLAIPRPFVPKHAPLTQNPLHTPGNERSRSGSRIGQQQTYSSTPKFAHTPTLAVCHPHGEPSSSQLATQLPSLEKTRAAAQQATSLNAASPSPASPFPGQTRAPKAAQDRTRFAASSRE
jgi:hypothetical protein